MTNSADDLAVELHDLGPKPTVAVRVTAPTPSLGELFDLHLPNIADRIADLGGEPAGAPFARYHEFSEDSVDVEIGIPVVAPVANLRPVAEAAPVRWPVASCPAAAWRSPSTAGPTRD